MFILVSAVVAIPHGDFSVGWRYRYHFFKLTRFIYRAIRLQIFSFVINILYVFFTSHFIASRLLQFRSRKNEENPKSKFKPFLTKVSTCELKWKVRFIRRNDREETRFSRVVCHLKSIEYAAPKRTVINRAYRDETCISYNQWCNRRQSVSYNDESAFEMRESKVTFVQF